MRPKKKRRGNSQVGQRDHDLDRLDPNLRVMRCCARPVRYRSNSGDMLQTMRIMRLPPGDVSWILHIMNLPVLPGRCRSRTVEIDDLSDV